jgi:3'-phosphoadenosine 5'-phosphosulfate sulfotransferase (PAPS reductase)/FAD synthetase
MSVYCDVCQQPGSPNDDAGYPKIGGWLCAAHHQTEFTPEEKRKLTKAITKAAVGIAECWNLR